MKKLSVGYLVDEGYQPNLIYELLEKSKSAEHYSIDYLIVQTFAENKNLLKEIYRFVRKDRFQKLVTHSAFEGHFALRKPYVCQGSQT